MSESKTKLVHTGSIPGGDERFECSTGDMSDRGFEIIVDKQTHELEIATGSETEDSVVVIIRPKGTNA